MPIKLALCPVLARDAERLGALWVFWWVWRGADGVKTRSAALQSRDFTIFSPVLARVSAGRWSKVGLDLRLGTHNFAALARV
jgi:hypothetical protein